MKKAINRFLSSNLSLRLLSIILSICLWMIVINTNDPSTTRTFSNVPVTILNESILTGQGKVYHPIDGDKISFSVRGKKSIVDKLNKNDFEVTADLEELSTKNTVPIKVTAKKYANSIDILYYNDKTLSLRVENSISVKLPVSSELKGNPADGFSVSKTTVNPETVTVTGPQSEIRKIKYVRVPVNIKGANKDIISKSNVVCYDASGNKLDSSNWKFDQKSVKVMISIGKSKKVPVRVVIKGEVASGYQIASIECNPAEVELSGSTDHLKNVTELVLPDISVKGANGTVEKEISLTDVELPSGVTYMHPDMVVKVSILINQEASQDLKLSSSDIDIQGLSDGRKVTFLENETVITVTGEQMAMSGLSVQDFHPYIQVDGLEEGEYQVSVSLKKIDGIIVKGSPQIRIKITEEEQED